MGSILYFMLYFAYVTQQVYTERFLVTAPSVFHVGVKETVSVQVGKALLNKDVTCYLEQEVGRVLMSKKETVRITQEGDIKTLELQVLPEKTASLPSTNAEPPYLNLVCDVGESKRKIARVLVSQHRGYIFIQTDQPMYNPTQKVQYRIFTLDHAMRPISKTKIYVYIINAEGNTVKKTFIQVENSIYSTDFAIPDVSQPGVWKIKAHYRNDEKSATIQEFKVQKFVLPSFGVTIKPKKNYLLISAVDLTFTIDVAYSYGKKINGGFHCRFGVREKTKESNVINFIKGVEQMGPVRNGEAEITVKISDLQQKLKPEILQQLAEEGAQFYIATTVTDTLSGEVQESEIFLPIVSQIYTVDLSRTRSHYIPKVPFDVRVLVLTPDGLPAKNVPVKIAVSHTTEKINNEHTDKEGTVSSIFNLEQTPPSISVEVTVEGFKSTKNVLLASSSSNSFLYININNKVLLPEEGLDVGFYVVNGKPEDDYIYYMILSKGTLRKSGSIKVRIEAKINIPISTDMVPSYRLIGYYYNTNGDIIADSVWVDVKDLCEGKIEVTKKESQNNYSPGDPVDLNIDVGNQRGTKVALLAVDKAIYALNSQNKLTPKQVFSSMQSYDLGCSYGGGLNTAAVFNDAGLAFISHSQTVRSQMRIGFSCESGFRRQRRSIDLQKQMAEKETEYKNEKLQKCCRHGLTLIPMKLTCEERKKRIRKEESAECVEAFLKCCLFATQLREKKRKEELNSGFGRTVNDGRIEDFFINSMDYIRQSFPPSFGFHVIDANSKTPYKIYVPDSITTWEVQAVSLSWSHGFCVADPLEIRVFQDLFISLRLPYSVKPNEQMAIVVVIYNYSKRPQELAVHMKQVEGLCSPGALSTDSYVNITLPEDSSETVTFSTVPLVVGEIPITIQLYDREFESGIDAIQKMLLVTHEGVQIQEEKSYPINLDGRSEKSISINGEFPNSTIPGSNTNIFVKLEEAYGTASAKPLLSPSNVEKLIRAPCGCAEQTMISMSPTALAIRYLDYSNRWLELSPGTRDTALNFIEKGYGRILTFKKSDGSYGAWVDYPTSTWLTALVVKVLSLVAKCQSANAENQIISQIDIEASVKYLIKQQGDDGSFSDPNPVIHREMQGGIGGIEQDASITAFITIALNHSLPFLNQELFDNVTSRISQATEYLLSRVKDLKKSYSVAITAYCLSTCLQNKDLSLSVWEKLKSLAKQVGECKVWQVDEDMRLVDEKKSYLVPSAVALTVETTAYALLTAIAQEDFEEAKMAACFLSSQENYDGGFKSTQDTIMALEALSEYMLHKLKAPFSSFNVRFSNKKRKLTEDLHLNNKGEKVEVELQRLLGNEIIAQVSGKGEAKLKVIKTYYGQNPFTNCVQLSINVTVQGKVDYTAQVTENYDYYDYAKDESEGREDEDIPRSAIEWFDARTRRRRDTGQNLNSEDRVVYEVCVSYSLEQNITGMAIADITLLSGFEANTEDLDKLKDLVDSYISHYEVTKGRVLLYFRDLPEQSECITFEAIQTVPIGLLQPVPATFYDYYEPDRRCSVLYAAPKRSKMVSMLCSGDVCQCAERACFKEKKPDISIRKEDRFTHACYQPLADYGFIVSVLSVEEKGNFELYCTNVTEVLKFNRDVTVDVHDIRVFAKRKHCRAQLEERKTYLIMGNDGSTTDSRGHMLYLLDSETWIEKKPDPTYCQATNIKIYCKGFQDFRKEYQVNGCSM
ncbi:complement C4-B [Trichomycterus rosablanca]|uniref:complement C4-B n=1 Tax=Trichomycterus rosablanca TaxID=2290929 RepID=UPI002F35BCD1